MVLVTRPKVLLLDEPFASLSEHSAKALADYLVDAVRYLGLSLIIVDHNLHLSSAIADRIYLIKEGTSSELQPGLSASEIALHLEAQS